MREITHRHAQNVVAQIAAQAALDAVPAELERRASIARTGSPKAALNGTFSDDGEFQAYLRLDIDNFDSGAGCAP